jgi:transmembrane sensor
MKKITSNEKAIELMIDEFDGNLSGEGMTELQQWIESGEENKTTYHEFHRIKNSMDILAVYKELDENTSWDALDEKLNAEAKAKTVKLTSHKNRVAMWWLSAAAMIVAVIGSTLYFSMTAGVVTLTTLANQHQTVNLPDGSSVVLNENTTLEYNKNEFAKNRELSLVKGEAFFEVVHNPENIFRINLGNLRITDIGTSFTVKRSDEEISVVVNEGRVAFEHLSYGNRVILSEGSKGIYLAGSKSIINTTNTDVNFKAWMDKKLNFNNTPLLEAAKVLEKTYGSKVVLKTSNLNNRPVNASTNYQTVDSALNVIATSLQLHVRKAGSRYIVE